MFTFKENVMFDDLPKDRQEALSRIGFKAGDNISEICKNILKEKGRTLDYYFSDDNVEENNLEMEKQDEI